MSGGGPNPKDAMTAEEREMKHARFLEALERIEQADHFHLFSPGPDFTIACSCDECNLKITKLKEFEDFIKSKNKLVMDYAVQHQDDESLCVTLCSTAEWTVQMLNLLMGQLEKLYEKLGVPFKKNLSASPIHVLSLQLANMLKVNGFPCSSEISECANDPCVTSVAQEIETGIYYYKQTRANHKAYALLEKIAQIEDIHEQEKGIAIALGEMLDPLISKNHIEKQIELVKQLPIWDLPLELEDLISKVCPRYNKQRMMKEAQDYLGKTSRVIIKKRMDFWRQFKEQPCSEDGSSKNIDKNHYLNGLNKTLESLLIMVDEFKSLWESTFEPFFIRYDRSDPKRQRIV